jgi:hypothetical protein
MHFSMRELRDLAPAIFTAPTYEAFCEKIAGGPGQAAAEQLDVRLDAEARWRASILSLTLLRPRRALDLQSICYDRRIGAGNVV